MIRTILLMTLVTAVAGCGGFSGLGGKKSQKAKTENTLPFKGRLSVGDDPTSFSVAVNGAGAGVEEVRESVRFEGTKYCLATNGSSDIQWATNGDDWSFSQDGGTLVFSGQCVGR
ncbi:MAG: hypothetical protein ABJ327_17170 [Litoreibacter sp.]